MNVMKRAEPLEVPDEIKGTVRQEPAEDWQYTACHNVLFESSSLPRLTTNNGNPSSQCYGKLTFDYRFKSEEIGKAVSFAYAVPYTYTDLLRDLDAAKHTLCALAGDGSASPGYRVIESPPKESAAPSCNGAGAPDVSPTAQPARKAPAMSAAQVWRSTVAKKKSAIDMYHE